MQLVKKIILKAIHLLLSPLLLLDYITFLRKNDGRFRTSPADMYPCILDRTIKTGFDFHYVFHIAWAARKVKEIAPAYHTDISSSLYFSTTVSAFVPVRFFDYRPADIVLQGLECAQCDVTALRFHDNSIPSLSCMHTVEHVGLGRYGDPIDPSADRTAMEELARVLAPGGSLLFVVPVGRPRIEYNAHRIYSYDMICDSFPHMMLKEFSLIDDAGAFVQNASPDSAAKQRYGCGCFWFVKGT